ncbi:glycoside hydrolase family 92 protein [Fulvivirga sp. M361]|uniref:GH92 family glycosyl hydrolase n=1 Tax=Fulvivirga sp. M361 TaxID=2594266 RepID=UPI00117998C3|nr:GH92 family glycosyl hydrolase [Fulvivirga sp. M361]TRX53362.1 glycoside hydrolase family 92 protein [Fulvivirga sp. M361]
MRKQLSIVFVSFLLVACSSQEKPVDDTRLVNYVNSFIGTDGKGNTYPGATVPYGMVQLSPDNGRYGWDWISGYFYPDTVIAGFSHLHLSGTGAGDLYDISFLPVSGRLKQAKLDGVNAGETVYSRFSHENEEAEPGYYQVYLEDYQVNVELTATTRTGLQKYTFEGEDTNVRLHLGYTRNWDKITDSFIKIVNDTTLVGYRKSTGWARDQRVFFKTIFSAPFQYKLSDGEIMSAMDTIKGLDLLAELSFNRKEVLIKTGLSSVSIDNASLNLETEQKGFDFDKVKDQASAVWEEALNKVQIKASPDNMVQFYTAMYHSMLAPTIYSDVNGEYKGTDGKVWKSEKHPRYTTYSLWDTYRALHPWLTITDPDRVPDLVNSMLDFYKEEGLLPVWNMWGSETNMMIGYHSVAVIADAILKQIPDIDLELAYKAMKASAMQDDFELKDYKALGYVPYENRGWNVSLTLEYAFDDWCIAQVARKLGKEEDYNYFMTRSMNYQNHFDSTTGFFRARSISGEFKPDLDPLAYHPEDYCEANAWQYYWYVPQDIEKLISLTGGESVFEDKLDNMFILEPPKSDLPEWISGYIGQYVHGNEPSHHVPYLYQFIDAPGKTQQKVRQIMDELYTTTPDGLCGNEDCGQMSAWYLFSALGFYPVNPSDGRYVFGSPEVEEATIYLPGHKVFKVLVKNQSKDNVYVKSVTFNGRLMDEYFIGHDQIMTGGELVFTMTDKQKLNEKKKR